MCGDIGLIHCHFGNNFSHLSFFIEPFVVTEAYMDIGIWSILQQNCAVSLYAIKYIFFYFCVLQHCHFQWLGTIWFWYRFLCFYLGKLINFGSKTLAMRVGPSIYKLGLLQYPLYHHHHHLIMSIFPIVALVRRFVLPCQSPPVCSVCCLLPGYQLNLCLHPHLQTVKIPNLLYSGRIPSWAHMLGTGQMIIIFFYLNLFYINCYYYWYYFLPPEAIFQKEILLLFYYLSGHYSSMVS